MLVPRQSFLRSLGSSGLVHAAVALGLVLPSLAALDRGARDRRPTAPIVAQHGLPDVFAAPTEAVPELVEPLVEETEPELVETTPAQEPPVRVWPDPTGVLLDPPWLRPPPPAAEGAPPPAADAPELVEAAAEADSATDDDSAGDSEPVLVESPPPVYPALAVRRGWEGSVTCRIRVSPAGRVAAASVEHSSGHRVLDEAALEAVRGWRFRGGLRGGEPATLEVLHRVTFRLSAGPVRARPAQASLAE